MINGFPPLSDVPKADAPLPELQAHMQRVRDAFAVRGYDSVVASCAWCTRSDVVLEVSRRRPGAYYQDYCCKECADAADSYQKQVYQKPRLTRPLTDDKVDEGEDT